VTDTPVGNVGTPTPTAEPANGLGALTASEDGGGTAPEEGAPEVGAPEEGTAQGDGAGADGSDPAGALGAPTDRGDAAGDRGPQPMADFSVALVSAVNVDLPNQHPTVVLRELESPRRQLSFSIGLPDGVVLSHAMRRIPTPRPLTHELLSEILQGFAIDVVAVRLVGRQGAVYFAEIDLRGRNGRSVHSCRPSDGLTIALLQPVPVPILIDRRLFEQAGDVTPFGAAPPDTTG